MMKKAVIAVIAMVYLGSGVLIAGLNTEIYYEITDLGAGRWQYTYDVHNVSLTGGIAEFTIWFGVNDYASLAIETQDPPASTWDELVWQPEPVFNDDGGYDALATGLNITPGQSVYGFTVSFDWLGVDVPGSQYYEIIDPDTFATIEDGYTIPEPTTLLFIFTGIGLISRRQKGEEK